MFTFENIRNKSSPRVFTDTTYGSIISSPGFKNLQRSASNACVLVTNWVYLLGQTAVLCANSKRIY